MARNLRHKKLKEKKFRVLDKESGYDKRITLKTFQLPNGMTENAFIDNNKSSVQIFAVTEDDQVLCVKQFRPGPEVVQLELPGGGLEDDENVMEAATRELLEETGYSGDKPIFLAALDYSPYTTGKKHLFVITNCTQTKTLDLDPNEFLEVVKIPLEKFRELMKKGQVRGYDTAYLGLDALGRL